MKEQSNNLDQIRDIFAIFHDGSTSSWTGDLTNLILKVDCEYLAERIDRTYESFYIECREINRIELDCWMNPFSLPPQTLFELDDIFKAPLEILSSKIEDGVAKVDCSQHDMTFDYCGGTLILDCNDIQVFDQQNRPITVDQLLKICNEYWADCSAKLEQEIIKRNQNK